MIQERWPHPACAAPEDLLAGCELRRGKASGPGGQRRNKVATAVDLTHRETGIRARATERRRAEDNRREALFRLRLALAVAVRSELSGDEEPSILWRSRVNGGRLACNPRHADYPALLAEALDVIALERWRRRAAAARLACSPSQLVRLVSDHPPALGLWNDRRAAAGLHRLKA